MSSLPPELVYVLVFAAILLFQYLIKRYAPQPEEVSPRPDALEEETQESADALAEAPASGVAFGRYARGEASRPGRRYSRRRLMGTRRAVQDAIVIATILGPCRAFEPHDPR